MNDYKTYKLFPSPVFHLKVNNYKELNINLTNYILKLKKNNKDGQEKSNYGGWHSPFFNQKEEPIKKFKHIVQNFLEKIFINEMGWQYDPTKIKFTVIWSIINEKGSYNIQHNHPNCYLSGAYYVKTSERSGNINFFEPKEQKNIRYPNIKKFTEFSAAITSIKPEEGDLLIFPSYLYHSVSKNLSTEERIVISFNIDIEN